MTSVPSSRLPRVGQLLTFLGDHGARIISAAARGGEGAMATALLRKIKECAVYAQRHGFGYLEGSGHPAGGIAEAGDEKVPRATLPL